MKTPGVCLLFFAAGMSTAFFIASQNFLQLGICLVMLALGFPGAIFLASSERAQ